MNPDEPTKSSTRTDAASALRKRMGDNLVAIGRNRDEAAFADVYSYYAGRVKSFLMGKGMGEEIAEELTQEIMLTVWRRAESYDPKKAAASTWLFTIARNRRIDYLRGNSRIEVELDDEMLDVETTDTDPQAKFVADEQVARQLERALEKLPQEQRQVMHLSYFRGQSHGAIAKWLDLPIGTVKSRIRLAMQAVRSSLESEGETFPDQTNQDPINQDRSTEPS
jgi:RNA polymerase sigma-70 factor (ECF subfamily)